MIKSNTHLTGVLKDNNKENEGEHRLKLIDENHRRHESLDSEITKNRKQDN